MESTSTGNTQGMKLVTFLKVDVDIFKSRGNGEDYKVIPNHLKAWEVSAYPRLLASIRAAIGPSKIMSAAVPGLRRDMLAFMPDNISSIMSSIDFLNIMTYDLFNRRDNATKHHTGLQHSLDTINAYMERGVAPERINLGLAFYMKWSKTAVGAECRTPEGCSVEEMEDPQTGADLGQAGAFSWHDRTPSELSKSFEKALKDGEYDDVGGGHWYWDKEERVFWSWDTPDAIRKKLPVIFGKTKLGGVFAWGLGEDAPKFEHLQASNYALSALSTSIRSDWGDKSEL